MIEDLRESCLNYPEMTWTKRGKGELRTKGETCLPALKIISYKSLWCYMLRLIQ